MELVKKRPPNPLEADAEALETQIEGMEKRFDRLKALYESFFSGVEKQPPLVPRREMNRLIVQMQPVVIGKSTLRFRYQSLLQRWVTYTAYWNRVEREIEQGTYQRDLAKVQRHLAETAGAITEEQARAMGVPASRVKAFVARQNRLVAQKQARGEAVASAKAPVARPQVPGVTDAQLRAFYEQYLQARGEVGDSRPARTLDELSRKLRPQIERVLATAGAQRAQLEVSVEAGKIKVLARPADEE